MFAAYATTRGHTLVDRELYLPKSWTEDRERCRAARVPDDRVAESFNARYKSPDAGTLALDSDHRSPTRACLRL